MIGNERVNAVSTWTTPSADARAILESMGDAFYALDSEWRIVYANRRAQSFWGLSADQVLGRSIWEALPQLIGTVNETALHRAHDEQSTITFEAPSPVNGVWVSVTVCPSGDGVTVYWRDIGERIRAEQELRSSEEHLRLAQDASGIGTWEYDPISFSLSWSDRCAVLYGLPPDTPMNDSALRDRVHPEDREKLGHAVAAALDPSGSGEIECEYRVVGPLPVQERWLLAKGRALFEDKRAVRLIGTLTDITQHKNAETEQRRFAERLEREVAERTRTLAATVAELRRSRERYSAIFEYAPVDFAVVAVLPDGRFMVEDTNPSMARHSGMSRESVVGKTIEEIFTPQQAAFALEHYRRAVATGEPVEYEYTARFPSGDVARRTFLVPLSGPHGRIEHVLLTAVDLTEMRRIEAQLRQSQKLEAIGQLTGGVAHDFNNLLTAVIGNLDLLERRLTDEQSLNYVNAAMRAAIRGGQLTQQLLAYARRQHLSPQPVDANTVIAGMGELLQRSLGGLVQVDTDLANGLWPATSEPTQLELVILNLAINSRDAMPTGGRICISTRNIGRAESARISELEPGEYVRIAVSDTGPGMPRHVVERAFEPFFTTKEIGKGSGLGLAQVYGVATQFGGTARLLSEAGAGTTVEVWLPRAPSAAPNAARTQNAADTVGGNGVILVVDDDADVRDVAATLLTEAGYSVRQAASGSDGRAILEAEPIALLLVDYAMPIMSGHELVRLARARRTDLPVIYVTGAADTLSPGQLNTRDPILMKPYTRAALLKIVRDMLRSANLPT